MKCVLILAVSLAVLLQAVSTQDDLAEGETGAEVDLGVGLPPRDPFRPPQRPPGEVNFVESFTDEDEVWKVWIPSKATKEGGEAKYDGKWELEAPSADGGLEEDQGLLIQEAAKHYAIAAKLEKPFTFDKAEAFVVQFEVNFQNGLTCGGAYIKLLTSAEDLDTFQDSTPYSIMFGPDRCGVNSKIHFILRFKNPVTGEIEEKHAKQSTASMDFFTDKKTHLYTLLIRDDGIYHIIVDQVPFLKGNILEDLTPPLIPPKEIDDPEDKMSEEWDEREKIPDPEAVKPESWDEDALPKIEDADAVKPDGWQDDGPEYVEDPEATMPEDWDEEEDGEYEPPMIPNPVCEEVGCGEWNRPMIPNPEYKGKWKAPMIDNPSYDGKWAPRTIDNPGYFEDNDLFASFSPVSAVGFELWTMTEGILIDNIIVCGDLTISNIFARDGWILKMESERVVGGAMSLGSWVDSFVELANTYPYLWALYAVALVLPFVCCIGCCCMKSKPDDAASRKKTDEPTPDDAQPLEPKDDTFIGAAEDQEEEEEEKGESGSQGEEEEAAGGSQEEEGDGGGSQEEEKRAGSPQDKEGSQEEGEKAAEGVGTESSPKGGGSPRTKSTSRKRKSRRED